MTAWSRRALLGAGLGALLAGCGSDGRTDGLAYPTWMLGEPGVGDYWRASVEEFRRRNPGVTVRFTDIPGNSYEDKVTAQLAAGNVPDIFPIFTQMIHRLVRADVLEPLDDYLAGTAWAGRQLPLAEVARVRGRQYGIVATGSPRALIYNRQLLERAGVGVPRTAEELLDAARRVRQRTGAWGFVVPTDTSQAQNAYITTMYFVLGHGGDWAAPDGTPTANAPETVRGLEFLDTLQRSGLMPRSMKVLDARNLFRDGKVALTIDGPALMTLLKNRNPALYGHCGFAATPLPNPVAVTGGAFFVLPRKSTRKDLVWRYLDMLNSQEWQRRWVEQTVQLAGQRVSPGPEFLARNPWFPAFAEIATRHGGGYGYAPPSPAIAPHVNEFQKLVVEGVAPIWNGGTGVRAGLDALQRRLVDWVDENGIRG